MNIPKQYLEMLKDRKDCKICLGIGKYDYKDDFGETKTMICSDCNGTAKA